MTYADYTASGRSLAFIEDFIRDAVLPLYGNTHTESSGTGRPDDALPRGCPADHRATRSAATTADHVVLFAGSGSTGAIDKLIDCLEIRLPADLDDRYDLRAAIPLAERPVVFIGPYEHHTNELPWRESLADLVMIREDRDGRIDLARLETGSTATPIGRSRSAGSRPPRTSPASSATSGRSRSCSIGTARCRSGTSRPPAPYVSMEMNPFAGPARPSARLQGRDLHLPAQVHRRPRDARRARRQARAVPQPRPDVPGGGTVAYVNPTEHRYLPTSRTARRAAPRPSSSRSEPGSCSP